MKRWCIINLEWLGVGDGMSRPNGDLLPERYRPGVFYDDRERAEAELFRLRKQCRGDFHLFEAVGKVVESPVAPGVFHLTGDL